MHIDTLTVGGFAMNSYLVADKNSDEAILIDPGAEAERIINFVKERNARPVRIINTHCHIDHVAELAVIQNYFNIPFYIHEEEKALLVGLEEQGAFFGIETKGIPDVSGTLNDGDKIPLGNISGSVLHTPGHSPGSLSFLFENHLFVGDCLFMDSIGRTDLYKGDFDLLMRSIREKIISLPDETIIYPGHGPSTTVGRERTNNPFLR